MATVQGQPFNQPSSAPASKLTAATIGTAVSTLIAMGLKQFLHFDLGVEGLGALAIVFTFLFGYVVKERSVE